MARPKSFLPRLEITCAGKAHGCQHNKEKHRFAKGDRRLTVSEGRNPEHFCLDCARQFLQADIKRLQDLLAALGE
ncbi:MAG: hypothetical protein KKA73_13420 [Chloroflexi bacterium]|nr:hypothetical protein [Armatimonadota bacterium]MBU1748681.1 hypothetical protein [Chloroflexota bacterium]